LLPLAHIGDAGRLSATTGLHQEIQNDIAAFSEEVQYGSYTCCERFANHSSFMARESAFMARESAYGRYEKPLPGDANRVGFPGAAVVAEPPTRRSHESVAIPMSTKPRRGPDRASKLGRLPPARPQREIVGYRRFTGWIETKASAS